MQNFSRPRLTSADDDVALIAQGVVFLRILKAIESPKISLVSQPVVWLRDWTM